MANSSIPIQVVVQHENRWPPSPTVQRKHVMEHYTDQLQCPENGWTLTRVSTGCIRVQKGDFTAYLSEEEADSLADFIRDTTRRD